MELDCRELAAVCKAFCDENRIKIMGMLSTGEKCACKLLEELDVTQPTLSHHMKILCDAGVVTGRREGKWMHYSISETGASRAIRCLTELTTVRDGEQDRCCEASDAREMV